MSKPNPASPALSTSDADFTSALAQIGAEIDHQPLRSSALARIMRETFHGSDAGGAWDWRIAYDLMQAAAIQVVLRGDGAAGDFAAAKLLASRLLTETRRSEQQIRLQQFSTPLPFAALVLRAAAIRKGETVLEPSAGTGALAAFAARAGATLLLNDIDPFRQCLLRALFGGDVTGHDGEHIDDLLQTPVLPDVVVMNPPFASSVDRSRDKHIAAKHLIGAAKRLAPGGRLVAIMPPGFTPERDAAHWSRACGLLTPRLALTMPGQVYRKLGTSVETQLMVFDKVQEDGEMIRAAVQDLEEVLPFVDAVAATRTEMRPVQRAAAIPHTRSSVPSSAPRKAAAAPVAPSKPRAKAVVPLSFTSLQTPRDNTPISDIYARYRPQRIEIASAQEHPTPLVESIAMASVAPPMPSNTGSDDLRLPAKLIEEGHLSEAQLETIIMAHDAHGRDLPGRFTIDYDQTKLTRADDDQDARAYRLGYFLGDGTGCGKGRECAGLILVNWLAGRRKAIWVSKSATLIEDAIRDWTDLGGSPADIQPLSKWKSDQPVPMGDGILFVTYATLRSAGKCGTTRLSQILEWMGAEFEGVLAFDEAHAMQNAAGSEQGRGVKPSQQGLAGLRLQLAAPRARVFYISATGATSVHNLAYAARLGLWGQGPEYPFPSRESFVSAMEAGGVAAMEVVARDLKTLGLYTARALSFDGVEYDVLEHALTPAQIEIYDAYAGAFRTLCAAAHNVRNREDAIMRRNAAPSLLFGDLRATSFTLSLLGLGSEGIEPGEQVRVTFPSRGSISCCRNADLFERLSLGFEIGLGVVVGRVETDMSQPASDDGDVDARRDEVDGRCVSEAVRRHMLRTKRGCRFRRRRDVGRQLVPHARGSQWFAVAIDEDALIGCARLPLQQFLQQRHSFRPERADTFLSALSVKTHAIRCFEPDRLGTEIERLLDACTTIIEQRQQHMVSHPFDRRSVRLREDGLDLSRFKVAGCGRGFALERDREDLGALGDIFGALVRHEAEEAADRGKPTVARADRALATMLSMVEERAHLAGGDVRQGDPCDTNAVSLRDEPEQQPPSVPIGLDGMDRGAALFCQPFLEEGPQQFGERIGRFHDSASPLRQGAPTARNRSLASCSRSCVTVM
ncbi:hypothetical protein DSM107133_04560 (plasmid) [Pseudosulfitobacter sp. DSM 107133]|nr:hypothetical protein DSM107133_04560 [Pseudosulfitobacter sp. DSM 107133]